MSADCTPLEKAAIEKALGIPAARWKELPRSSLLASVRVRGAVRIDRVDGVVYGNVAVGDVPRRLKIAGEELFGDFGPGRWAWLLDDVQPFAPIPCSGAQGIWSVTR